MESGGARTYGHSAALLTVALGVAGTLVYLFFAVASHVLDAEAYGRIVVLWSVMFLLVSVLFRPVELLLARSVAHARAAGAATTSEAAFAAKLQVAATAVCVVASLVFKDTLEDKLFGGDALLFWSLVASLIGFAVVYWMRGYLAGTGQFGLYSLVLLSDGICRGLFAIAVGIGISNGFELAALGIAIPPALSALVTLGAWNLRNDRDSHQPVHVEETSEFTLVEGGGFAASVLVVMSAEQVFLNSGPLFALARDGEAAAGYVFNILMIVRAPVLLFQATVASLLPHLTRLRARGGPDAERDFRMALLNTIRGIGGFTVAAAVVVLIVGPGLMELAFGEDYVYERLGLLAVVVGMGLYLVATTLTQAVLANGQPRAVAVAWITAAAAFAAWLVIAPLDVDRAVEIGLAGGAALLCGLLMPPLRCSKSRTTHP